MRKGGTHDRALEQAGVWRPMRATLFFFFFNRSEFVLGFLLLLAVEEDA